MTLKEIRKSKGITQKHVTQYLNDHGIKMSYTSLSNKEAGRTQFTLEEAKMLCLLYGITDLNEIDLC